MLIADHIVPIALGGPQWDINNIQTLCLDCNRTKTAHDAADIAAVRAQDKADIELTRIKRAHAPLENFGATC